MTVRLPRPAGRRRAFTLTPLADVMFQLLIFFMLSTSLAPYALLPLGGGPAPETDAAPPPRAAGTPAPAIWQLGAGIVRAEGRDVPLAEVGPLAAAATLSGVPEIILFAGRAATVQDMATALEALRAAGVPRVRLVGRTGPG